MTDNAKESLALADKLDNSRHLDCFDEAMVVMTLAGRDLVISALRLSARQQASVESIVSACVPGGQSCDPQQIADALRCRLAKYDIFEKVEG